jgi:hypothetical protein
MRPWWIHQGDLREAADCRAHYQTLQRMLKPIRCAVFSRARAGFFASAHGRPDGMPGRSAGARLTKALHSEGRRVETEIWIRGSAAGDERDGRSCGGSVRQVREGAMDSGTSHEAQTREGSGGQLQIGAGAQQELQTRIAAAGNPASATKLHVESRGRVTSAATWIPERVRATAAPSRGEYDARRLRSQRDIIRDVMLAAADCDTWLTLGELHALTQYGEASISAQLRHLRKPENGGYDVVKRHREGASPERPGTDGRGDCVWEYSISREARAVASNQ